MIAAVRKLKEKGSYEHAYELINQIKDLCPPGIEWGFELARLAGVSYIAEGGRIVALSISRGEFGPFMDSRMKEIPVNSIPVNALSRMVSDPEGFLNSFVNHLLQWLKSSSTNSPLRAEVLDFVNTLSAKR
ncbi:hypothetical protein HRbin02_01498 [Candidatus Calditenuaceae archaeon HR02]|nr:hypothetical protein HRbin02_01498 [Candidatus Calditenuaceae archaeon HR02]